MLDDIKERLDKGLIDIGLLTEPVDIEKYEFVRLEQKEVWGILAPKDSKLAAKEYATPQDLLKLPLLSTRRTIVQNEIANWFGQDYEQLDIIATYNLIYNAAIMVEEGIGHAICLEKLVNINDENKNSLYSILSSIVNWNSNRMEKASNFFTCYSAIY